MESSNSDLESLRAECGCVLSSCFLVLIHGSWKQGWASIFIGWRQGPSAAHLSSLRLTAKAAVAIPNSQVLSWVLGGG